MGKRKSEGGRKSFKKRKTNRYMSYKDKMLLSSRRLMKNPEVKFVDNNFNQQVSYSGFVELCNEVSLGTTAFTRLGQKINLIAFSLRIRLTSQGILSTAGSSDVLHVALVFDKQPNGATITYDDVFSSGGSSATLLACQAPRNINNLERFEVIKREMLEINQDGSGAAQLDWYCKLNHVTRYNGGNAGTIADINSGALYVVMCTSKVASASSPLIFGVGRLRFVDA